MSRRKILFRDRSTDSENDSNNQNQNNVTLQRKKKKELYVVLPTQNQRRLKQMTVAVIYGRQKDFSLKYISFRQKIQELKKTSVDQPKS